MADPVLLAIDERGVATITLNRPERLNAINMVMRDLLWEYLQACRDHPDVRAVCFRGEGRAFSAGADISEFGTAPSLWESRRAVARDRAHARRRDDVLYRGGRPVRAVGDWLSIWLTPQDS